jgi:hypothetical protein
VVNLTRAEVPVLRKQQNQPVRRSGSSPIRTRDPHFGKVVIFVPLGLACHLKCGPVHPVFSTSTKS